MKVTNILSFPFDPHTFHITFLFIYLQLVTSLSLSSKPSRNVASRSNFNINSIDPVSLESILATEKESINIQYGDVFITFAALTVVPVNYSSGGTQIGL